MRIRPYQPVDLKAVIDLSLRAWAPVFDSLRQVLDADVYRAFYPDGWEASQSESVEAACTGGEQTVWVAEEDGAVVGFVAVCRRSDELGEIYMIAVDPDHQQSGIGSELTQFAMDWMKQSGIAVAMVETGGDPGHDAARRTYAKNGFRLFPVARYFKYLA